ncbi:TAP-like protein-domain-containing protein [Mycena latifolia]|nr:TAP-like protein-domain-containing protein [Mycena latifolia]
MVGTLTRVAVPCLVFAFFYLVFSVSPFNKFSLASIQAAHAIPEPRPGVALTASRDNFSWGTIVPTEELVWTDCYSDNQQCARLKVPLDYSQPDGASAAIAMVRIHSIVAHDSPSYRGPILLNPGGPGGSGVDFVARRGAQISTIVGPEFDVIGFDPRGIGRSTPRASFFESRAEREIWSGSSDPSKMSLNASADALSRAWAWEMILGQLAGERDKGSLRFINTDHTARDMLQIVQAHGQDKIQYWGFSYGSILGATFASMFPENVGRLVIDGVADSENYFATEWSNNLLNTDKVWSAFIDGCVAAGPEACAFFSPTAAEISENVDMLYASLRDRPIPVRTNVSFGLVDYSVMRRAIFQALYSPYAAFPTLAQALADLSAGNATGLFKLSEKPPFECACDESQYRFESVGESGHAVLCNDGKRIAASYEDIVAHYETMREMSEWADVWEPIRMGCLAWPEFPKDNFRGPFIANTSFPLLLVGNTADPVTPLWAAHKMSKGFNGSVVLTQDSPGHCSTSGPSICTQKYIRQYFLEGTLPEPGTVCPVIGSLFPTDDFQSSADAQAVLSLSAADRALFDAVNELAMTSHIRFPAGL